MELATAAARLDDPAALRELLEPCAAVISCAGPFVEHGEPVVRAAVAAGTHYLDTTGEQPFMRAVFDDHGPRAERAGVALLTAMGFDYAPGDMLAALAAEDMGPLDEIVLAYCDARLRRLARDGEVRRSACWPGRRRRVARRGARAGIRRASAGAASSSRRRSAASG